MSDYYKRRTDDEDDTGPIGKRKPHRPEPEPKRKGRVSRFPVLADGKPALGFATLSHSNLKTWAKVAKAHGHNTRQIEAPNVRKDAPKPIELLKGATGSYGDRVVAVLKAHGVPNVRTNAGAIVTEDIYGASPEYWNRAGDWKLKSVEEIIADPVIQAGIALAHRKHGKRLISISLHVDEESPHIHVVAVPLVEREHAPRGPKPKDCELDAHGKPIDYRPRVRKWTLDPSSLRGSSRDLEKNHDEWAAECEPFGLARGERGSDMSKEARRARRNRQTGRSSIAEKEARERRESSGAEAEADRDRAKKLAEDAEEKQAAAEAAMAEAERLKIAQADRDRELRELVTAAAADRTIAADERKKAAEARRAANVRLAEADRGIEQNKAASVALDQTADSMTRLMQLLVRIINPECSAKVVLVEGSPQFRGVDPSEAKPLPGLPEDLKDAVAEFLWQSATIAEDREFLKVQQDQLQLDRQKLESDRRQLDADRELYERTADILVDTVDRAREFLESWTAIPADARTPEVNAAVSAAAGLTPCDLPQGYEYPGTGQQSASR